MMRKITLLTVCVISFFKINAQQIYPGGVPGAEVWYSANPQDMANNLFTNMGNPNILIESCAGELSATYFNFNYSFGTAGLCLKYSAPLENTMARNVFFVGEPKETGPNLSHLTTQFTNPTSTITVNRFDFSNLNSFNNNLLLSYISTSPVKEVINFYNWNNYQIDTKHKSYGLKGETTFYIGKGFTTPAVSEPFENSGTSEVTVQNFIGNFPEYISFPFELSNNQKDRVESYLALKYGITLYDKDYLNSKNFAFWNRSNNTKFKNNIFGIGRDKNSNLNQLQSESVHRKEYLAASVAPLALSNPQKQQEVQIDNDNFIVFGDNGRPAALNVENSFGVQPLKRIWLSQNTGDKSITYPMSFNFNFEGEIADALSNNPSLKLWMLHDRYVSNNEESDFDSQYVEYYEATSIQDNYSKFDEVFFDTDKGVYDQYTFGVGPQMIVQARFDDNCDDDRVRTNVVITGGVGPYKVNIINTTGYYEDFITEGNILPFEATAPGTYTIYVQDSYGNDALTTLDVVLPQITVNLDPVYYLNATQTQVTIDAGIDVADPDATYQWFHNSALLEFTGAALTTSEPGKYVVIITSGNRLCTSTDETSVQYRFTGSLDLEYNCDPKSTSISLSQTGGTLPYTAVIESASQNYIFVFNTENFLFENIVPGQYTVTVTDLNNTVWGSPLLVKDPLDGIALDLYSQLEQICTTITNDPLYTFPIINCPQTTFTLDASLLVTNPNVSYEWFMNGVSLGIYDTTLEFSPDPGAGGIIPEFSVKIRNEESGCSISESFGIKGFGIDNAGDLQAVKDDERIEDDNKEDQTASNMRTKIYPNPSDHNATFYYEVTATEIFDGVVRIFSTTGALVKEHQVTGQSTYTIPFYLISSGTYFVSITTNGKTVTDKIIIK